MPQFILSAQNFDIYPDDGRDPFARTGAISLDMLAAAGAEGVIIGHPETRDPVAAVHGKVLALQRQSVAGKRKLAHLTLMVGETWDEFVGHTAEQAAAANVARLSAILDGVPPAVLKDMVVGYDPTWGSRGNGHDDDEPPAVAYISACAQAVKSELKRVYGEAASNVPLIYGGRSTPERTEEILTDVNIDGLILGSACNTVEKAMAIAASMQKVMGARRKVLHANFKAYNLPDSYRQYIEAFKTLDDSFTIYMSPNYADIRSVRAALNDSL